jgi:hypothetical protein
MSSDIVQYKDDLLSIPDLLCWSCRLPAHEGSIHRCGVLECCRSTCSGEDSSHPSAKCKDIEHGWIEIKKVSYIQKALDNLLVGCNNKGCNENFKYIDKKIHKCKVKKCTFCLRVDTCAVIDAHIDDINLCVGKSILPNWVRHPQFKNYLEEHKIISNTNSNNKRDRSPDDTEDDEYSIIQSKHQKVPNFSDDDVVIVDMLMSDAKKSEICCGSVMEWFNTNQRIIGDKITIYTAIKLISLATKQSVMRSDIVSYIRSQNVYTLDKSGTSLIKIQY